MKKLTTVFIFTFSLFTTIITNAQVATEFVKGSITLADGTKKDGFIKDNLIRKGNFIFMETNTSKNTTYDGTEINAFNVNDITYQSINGDFFKTICTGKICFLQKASKTLSKILYSGTTPIGITGTSGKIGDYYIYMNSNLQLLTKKNVINIITEACKDCTSAVKDVNSNDIATVATIITSYNNCK